LVAEAESAYKLGDVWRGDEALAQGHAASFRAARLLAQVADYDRALLVRDLESLQSALNGLPANIVGNLGPEGNMVLPSQKLPTSCDGGPPLDPSGLLAVGGCESRVDANGSPIGDFLVSDTQTPTMSRKLYETIVQLLLAPPRDFTAFG
jgi:hypothetical protein